MTSFGDSIGNSLGADSGAGIGGGAGWPVPPWKFGVSAGAMMGRGGT